MSNNCDPHHLVAIMRYVYENAQDSFPRRNDFQDQTLEHGITDDQSTNIRTLPILDALASLSIYQEQHQVVAIAIQVDAQNHKIRLSIAQNDGVPDQVEIHLSNIWQKLQILSEMYAAEQPESNPYMERSPKKIPKGVALPLRVELFRDICMFTLEKLITRGDRWKPGLCRFMQQLMRYRKGRSLQGFEQDLFHAAIGLLELLKSLRQLYTDPQKHFTDDEWIEIYHESMWASKCAKRVLEYDNRNGCEKIAKRLAGMSLLPVIGGCIFSPMS